VFVGGYAHGTGSTLDGRYDSQTAIDSNITTGEQEDVHHRVPDDPEVHAARRPDRDQPDRQTVAGRWSTAPSPSTSRAGGIFAASDAVIRDKLPDPERPVRLPVGADPAGRLAHGRALQRLGGAKRDQPQRHVWPVGAAAEPGARLG
jgi:hypothetical protein